jgi:hypothetical protein
MQEYKFHTRISDTGAIFLPEPSLFNKEVEVIIVPKIAHSKKVSK